MSREELAKILEEAVAVVSLIEIHAKSFLVNSVDHSATPTVLRLFDDFKYVLVDLGLK